MSTITMPATPPASPISVDREQLVSEVVAGDSELSTSVGKALALLGAFDADKTTMGVSELARMSGLPKSTAFRLLNILAAWGLLRRENAAYTLGPRLMELASIVAEPPHQHTRDVALPYLQDLYELTHETVHLAVPDGTDIVYVEKLYGHNRAKSPSRVGARLQAGCSALGKAMLAFSDARTVRQAATQLRPLTRYTISAPGVLFNELANVRQSRVAYDREEVAIGLTCVAAPVLSRTGQLRGAVSVSGPVSRFNPAATAQAVRRAAFGIATALDAPVSAA